ELANRAASEVIQEQRQTKTALQEAEKQRRLAERHSTSLALDRALNLCEQGDVGLGTSWLARSLEIAPAEAPEFQRVIRANLANWSYQLSPLQALFQHEDAVLAVAFSPNGKRVLTGSWDQTAWLWDAASGRPIVQLRPHRGSVGAVAFSPDGRTVL